MEGLSSLDPAPAACCQIKIKVSGRLSGKLCSREPDWGLRALVCARVLAVQEPYMRLRNLPVIHGKEKVYGSIP